MDHSEFFKSGLALLKHVLMVTLRVFWVKILNFMMFMEIWKFSKKVPQNCWNMFYWWLSGSYIPIWSQNIEFCDICGTFEIFEKRVQGPPKLLKNVLLGNFRVLCTHFELKYWTLWCWWHFWKFLKQGPQPRVPKIVEIYFIDDF